MSLLGGIVGAIAGSVQQAEQNDFNAHQAAINRQFQADQAQLAYERTLSADSTKYQRQVADLEAAGLNPMLAVSQSAGSVQASPASGSQATAANVGNIGALLLQGEQLRIEKMLADAKVRNMDADTDKKIGETAAIELNNAVNSATKDARIEAARLENELTRGKVEQIRKGIDEADARIGKLIAETSTESERKNLITCQAMLARAEAGQIIALLPYEKQLKEAKTEEARQAALLSAAHTAYQEKLLSDGYIDSFIRNMSAEADSAEARAALDNIKAAIRTGDYSKTGDLYKGSMAKGIMQGLTLLLDNLNPLTKLF